MIVLWPDIRLRMTLGFRRGEFPQLDAPWGALSAPNGSAPHGELFAEDSGATGGLGIRGDNIRDPVFGYR